MIKVINNKSFIFYGGNISPAKFKEIKNFKRGKDRDLLNKPCYGLWSSPLHSKNSWKKFLQEDWIEEVHRLEKYSIFKVKKCRIFEIKNIEDIKYLQKHFLYFKSYGRKIFNYKKLIDKLHLDGIYFNFSEFKKIQRRNNWMGLFIDISCDSYDCDSLILNNLDCIKIIKER